MCIRDRDIGDLNLIEDVSKYRNVPILQKIPYEREILKKHSRGQPITHNNIKKLSNAIMTKNVGGTHG